VINPPKFGGRVWSVKKEEQVIDETEMDPDKLHEEIDHLDNEHSRLSREAVRLRRERDEANERAEKERNVALDIRDHLQSMYDKADDLERRLAAANEMADQWESAARAAAQYANREMANERARTLAAERERDQWSAGVVGALTNVGELQPERPTSDDAVRSIHRLAQQRDAANERAEAILVRAEQAERDRDEYRSETAALREHNTTLVGKWKTAEQRAERLRQSYHDEHRAADAGITEVEELRVEVDQLKASLDTAHRDFNRERANLERRLIAAEQRAEEAEKSRSIAVDTAARNMRQREDAEAERDRLAEALRELLGRMILVATDDSGGYDVRVGHGFKSRDAALDTMAPYRAALTTTPPELELEKSIVDEYLFPLPPGTAAVRVRVIDGEPHVIASTPTGGREGNEAKVVEMAERASLVPDLEESIRRLSAKYEASEKALQILHAWGNDIRDLVFDMAGAPGDVRLNERASKLVCESPAILRKPIDAIMQHPPTQRCERCEVAKLLRAVYNIHRDAQTDSDGAFIALDDDLLAEIGAALTAHEERSAQRCEGCEAVEFIVDSLVEDDKLDSESEDALRDALAITAHEERGPKQKDG